MKNWRESQNRLRDSALRLEFPRVHRPLSEIRDVLP